VSGIALKFLVVVPLLAASLLAAEPDRQEPIRFLRTRTSPLKLPFDAGGQIPPLLSQTGAFLDLRDLTPADGLIPYALNAPFWSDGAEKSRWIALPDSQSRIQFSPDGPWTFPKGTVFVKHFELPGDSMNVRRRLETRFLVCDSTGSVYGVTYKWRADGREADLLTTNLMEAFSVRVATGIHTQNWYYPSRADCRTCHTDLAGGVLGVNTRQLNRELQTAQTQSKNQLVEWSGAGRFQTLVPGDPVSLPRLADPHDSRQPLEARARSYLDANCAQCHRPGGTVASFDTRYSTPLKNQNLLNGPVLIDEGIDAARIIAPNDIWRSILFQRLNTLEPIKMPPLAHQVIDHDSVALLKQWIESLPGPRVLAPPLIQPAGGTFTKTIEVKLSSVQSGVEIHYTLDGSIPDKNDPLYSGPVRLVESGVLRAKAFKPGFKKSITSQQIFMAQD
jgi:uncharacterized repeat protein (TIGR03806 family)